MGQSLVTLNTGLQVLFYGGILLGVGLLLYFVVRPLYQCLKNPIECFAGSGDDTTIFSPGGSSSFNVFSYTPIGLIYNGLKEINNRRQRSAPPKAKNGNMCPIL
jgi:hypothetical protein